MTFISSKIKSVVRIVFVAVFVNINTFLFATQTDDPVISAIKQEVDRNFSELKIDGLMSPFFISYVVIDLHQMKVEASFGAITQSFEIRERVGMPLVLVGSFEFNNLKYEPELVQTAMPQKISLDNSPAGIGVSIWADLDREYKRAVQNYESKKNALSQTRLTPEEQALPDYEKTPLVNLILPPEKINIDRRYWENYARIVSEIAIEYPEIIESTVEISFENSMNYYYDTEGSQFAVPSVQFHIYFVARVIVDGKKLEKNVTFRSSSYNRLPSLETFVEECEKKIVFLLNLRNAPLADKSYSGPVLYEKEALVDAIQTYFFFSNNSLLSSYKLFDGRGGNNLELMTGERIVSDQMTVKSLSGTKIYREQILDGYFPVDGEGIAPAEELILIENGVLKNMLNRRVPTLKNQRSNGHYRFQNGNQRTIQPGIIQVTGSNTYPNADMKNELIDAASKAGLEYGYIVNNNGYTRVYVDDGREELVRGIYVSDDYDNNLFLFRRILGVSDEEFFSPSVVVSRPAGWRQNVFLPALSTYIVPKSILFEEIDLIKDNNANLHPTFLIPKPTE